MKFIKIAGRIAFLTAIIFSVLAKKINAQFVNNGSTVTLTTGATIYTQASFTNTSNGIVINDGSIKADSNIINDAGASLSGNGNYIIQANFTNNGDFDAGNSVLEFTGAVNSTIKDNTGSIYTLQLSKAENKYVTLLNN